MDVARAYALRYRYDDAEKLVQLAETLYPDDAHLQQMLGRSYEMIRQFDRSIACYRRSLELAPTVPNRPEILWELAKMHERLHDLDSARECAEESLALAPQFDLARYTLANIYRRAGEIDKAEGLWTQIIETTKSPKAWAADSWYQLGSLHDKAGRFDQAFVAATNAKRILQTGATPYEHEAKAVDSSLARNFLAVTAEHCQRWHAAGAELSPLGGGMAVLCSHPRSGTTLLEQVLDSHPSVISANEIQVMSEVAFGGIKLKAEKGELSKDQPNGYPRNLIDALDSASLDDVRELRQAYWKGMEGAMQQSIGGRILLDKNPDLTMLLPLIAKVFPDMRDHFRAARPTRCRSQLFHVAIAVEPY